MEPRRARETSANSGRSRMKVRVNAFAATLVLASTRTAFTLTALTAANARCHLAHAGYRKLSSLILTMC